MSTFHVRIPRAGCPSSPAWSSCASRPRTCWSNIAPAIPAAVAEVQRFERQPDPAAFALSDAQRVLARAYGYESWPKLKAFVDGANVARLAEAVQAGDIGAGARAAAVPGPNWWAWTWPRTTSIAPCITPCCAATRRWCGC